MQKFRYLALDNVELYPEHIFTSFLYKNVIVTNNKMIIL